MNRIPGVLRTLAICGLTALTQVAVAQDAPMKITLAGGSVGGAWSAVGSAIGEAIKREYPGSAFTYEPSRELANITMVSQGRIQLGIAHAQFVKQGMLGQPPFKAPLTNVRAIAQFDPQATVQVVVRKSSGITSLEQLGQEKKPVRVAFNLKGTMMSIAGEQMLAAYGVTPKDIEAWGGRVLYVPYNEGLDLMKNGQIDLIMNMLAYPAGQLLAATKEMEVQMLPLSSEAISKIDEALGTRPLTIPANSYPFQPEAMQTVTGNVIIVANADMSDADAGRIVNAMIKQFAFLKQAHATLGRLDVKSLAQVGPVPLHPGAQKAYQAAGLLN